MEDLVICRRCGNFMLMDAIGKVEADLGLVEGPPVYVYNCERCGITILSTELSLDLPSDATLELPF